MKKTWLILILLYTQIGISQDSNLSVMYSAQLKEMDTTFLKNKSEYIKTHLLSQFESKKEIINEIDFELICDDDGYYLSYIQPIPTDDFFKYQLTGAISRVFDANYILADKTEEVAILAGFESAVKMDRSVEMNSIIWEKAKMHKEIIGYNCQMYIGKLVNDSSAHKGHYPITAWVTDALQYSCGPTPFAILEGVILELENDDSIVTATCINRTKKSIPEYKSEFRLLSYPEYITHMEEWSKKNMPRRN